MENKFLRVFKKIWHFYNSSARAKLTNSLEYETGELEHIFSLLVLGVFVGLPAPPMQITLDLLPEMEKELILLFEKVDTATAPLSDLASILDIG